MPVHELPVSVNTPVDVRLGDARPGRTPASRRRHRSFGPALAIPRQAPYLPSLNEAGRPAKTAHQSRDLNAATYRLGGRLTVGGQLLLP